METPSSDRANVGDAIFPFVNGRCHLKQSLPFQSTRAVTKTREFTKMDELRISGSRFHVRSRVISGQLIQKKADEPQHDAVDGGTKSKSLKKPTGWNVSLQSVVVSGS